jgi:hypothetical protein
LGTLPVFAVPRLRHNSKIGVKTLRLCITLSSSWQLQHQLVRAARHAATLYFSEVCRNEKRQRDQIVPSLDAQISTHVT